MDKRKRGFVCACAVFLASYIADCGGDGYCSFPSFLWQPLPGNQNNSKPRLWISRTEFLRNTQTWTESKEIYVQEKEIHIQHKIHASCDAYSPRRVSDRCHKKIVRYHIICVSEEAGHKFRVQQEVNGKFTFTCLQFVARTPHVIQVFSGGDDSGIQSCPFTGGFDFVAYDGARKSKVCPKEWKPSRFESECIRDEPLHFTFPSQDCSPFNDQVTNLQLWCWGDWIEGQYMFVILGEKMHLPRYVMRLPKDFGMWTTTETIFFYFSPVVPLSGHGDAPGLVRFVEMWTKRSDVGLCYDAADKCSIFAKQGKCVNTGIHRYANYCMKSCGLCGMAPSAKHECAFPPELHGSWVLFNSEGTEELSISGGTITSSTFGTFICKGKHWQTNFYKVFSSYHNGCRPRYTCLQLNAPEESQLQVRMSRSTVSDESFSICDFDSQNELPPRLLKTGDMHRFIKKSSFHYNSCGITGTFAVNATFSNWISCQGILTNQDPVTCATSSSLIFNFNSCSIKTSLTFSCVAFVQITEKRYFIVTQSDDVTNDHICWLATLQQRKGSYEIDTVEITQADCSTGTIMYPFPQTRQLTMIKVLSVKGASVCESVRNSKSNQHHDMPNSHSLGTETTISSTQLTSSENPLQRHLGAKHRRNPEGGVSKAFLSDSASFLSSCSISIAFFWLSVCLDCC